MNSRNEACSTDGPSVSVWSFIEQEYDITNVRGYGNDNEAMESLYVGHNCQPVFFFYL